MTRRPVEVRVEGPLRPRLVTIQGAADYVGLSVSWIKARLAEGELGYVRIGRRRLIELAELDRYVDERRQRAGRRGR